MEVQLSDDQTFFGDTTRRFLAEQCPIERVRALVDDPRGYEASYWAQGAELGWTSLLVGESDGGGSVSGSGVVDLTVVADAFGRGVAPGPLVPANVVAWAISTHGTERQRSEHIPAMLAGTRVGAWCGVEASLGHPGIRADRDGDDYVLSGSSAPVEGGGQADVLLVSAVSDGVVLQALVPAGADGLEVTPLTSIDLVRRYARVDLDRVRVGPEALVGEPDDAALERQLQLALVMQAAEMVGAAETAFDLTVEWAFDRYSFGRPLCSYQALKHRFADMKMWLEASHALATALARDVQGDTADVAETASATKSYLGDHLGELLQQCVQLHGGIGLTSDHDLHLYLRRVTAGRATYGTPAAHRARIADLVAAA